MDKMTDTGSASLTVGDKTISLPIFKGALGPDVIDVRKLYAETDAFALARRGKTVILSSHLLSDVEDVCDRVIIYYGGRIQAMGTLTATTGAHSVTP